MVLLDLGTALVAVAITYIVKFVANHLQQLVGITENIRKLFNFF